MPRKLPWKNEATTRITNDEYPVGNDRAKVSRLADGKDPTDKTDTNGKESDDSDDENYRITESEFMDTARYFTKELHQQAYDRLLQEQQKEIDAKNSLSDLLEQPALQDSSTSSTLNHAILESKSRSVDLPKLEEPRSEVKISKLPSSLGVAAPIPLPSHEPVVSVSKPLAQESPDLSLEEPTAPKVVKVTKLSDAAIARRQKRQQAQKTDSAAVPFF